MPQEPRILDPTLSACDRFGAVLRQWRQRRQLSQAQLASALPVTPDQIAKYEKALRWPTRKAAERLDEFLEARGELVALWAAGDAERQTVPGNRQPPDPSLIAHWNSMLGVLAAAGNAVGGRGLLGVVATEVGVISRYSASATGHVRAGFLRTQARWLEFGSWIADNEGDHVRATALLKQAGRFAELSSDSDFGIYVLMRRAQRASEAGEARLALDLIARAAPGGSPPRVRALLAIRAAQAHAAIGDGRSAAASLKLALDLVAGGAPSDSTDLEVAQHCTAGYVRAHEALCLRLLGEPIQAARLYEDVLKGWPSIHRLDEGLFRAQLAECYAFAGALDEAVGHARSALTLGAETGSLRTMRVVERVMAYGLDGAVGYEELTERWATTIKI